MQTLLSVCVFLMMLCIGLDFSFRQWQSLLGAPRPIVVGILIQNLLTPAIAFGVAWCFRNTPEIALAIVLIVASPGGPVANAIVHYAGARIDLSISLTAINGLLCIVTAPLIADLGFLLVSGAESGLKLPLGQTIKHLVAIIMLPVILGCSLNHFAAQFVGRVRSITRTTTILLLIGTLLLVFIQNLEHIHLNLYEGLVALGTLCFMMLSTGVAFSRLTGLGKEFSFAIANEVSVHNVPLALLMAEGILKRPELSGLIILYVPVIFAMTIIYAQLYRYQHNQEPQDA